MLSLEVEVTRLLYSNVFKAYQVNVQGDDKIVIDNNERVAQKIAQLREVLTSRSEDAADEEGFDGFTGGLDAEQVEALVADVEGDEVSSVIKGRGSVEEEKVNAAETMAAVSAQAEEILASARREADSIKSNALTEALAEIEAQRKSVYEEAKSQGYDAGYNEAIEQVEQQRKDLQEQSRRLEAEYQQLVDELEPKFVETLTDIYEKVFQIDLKKEHDIIMHLISSTMHKIEGNSNYLIHVSKEDYPYVNMKKNEALASAISSNASIEIVEDMTLGANDCIIETDGGVFDCGLGTQLEELSQKLRLLSYTKG